MAERTRDDLRALGFLILAIPVVPLCALLVFSSARTLWFTASGPVVPVEVVECHAPGKYSYCTGVWRPTGEPEKTVTIHGRVAPHETVDVRIHGDEAWANDKGLINRAWSEIGFWGIGGLIFMLAGVFFAVRAGAARKSAPRPIAPSFRL